jgi:hypothetical protein
MSYLFNLQCSPEQPTKAPNMAKGATVFGLGHQSTAKEQMETTAPVRKIGHM